MRPPVSTFKLGLTGELCALAFPANGEEEDESSERASGVQTAVGVWAQTGKIVTPCPSVGRASIVSRGDGRGRIQEGREGGRDNLLRNYARASPTPDGVRRVAIAGGDGGGRVSPFLVAIHGPELQGCVGFLKYGMNLGIGGQN